MAAAALSIDWERPGITSADVNNSDLITLGTDILAGNYCYLKSYDDGREERDALYYYLCVDIDLYSFLLSCSCSLTARPSSVILLSFRLSSCLGVAGIQPSLGYSAPIISTTITSNCNDLFVYACL